VDNFNPFRDWHYDDCAKLTVGGECDCGSIEQHLRESDDEELDEEEV
jgi:hypothetical protein